MASRIAGAWVPSGVVMVCVAAQLAVSAWGGSLGRPSLIAVLAGLAIFAVGVSLFWTMGLRRQTLAPRLMILVPILITVIVLVALMLDGDFRRHEAPSIGHHALARGLVRPHAGH